MKEIKINVDNYNENSIKTIEGDNLSEVYKIYICKNKRRVNLTNKIAIMAYVNEYGNKKSNILALNITNASQGEIELPITNVISNENGVYACQIAIYGENNFLEQTAPFSLVVENNIFSKISNTAINSTDFYILSEAIKTTNAYCEKLKEGTENIELQYAYKLNEKLDKDGIVTMANMGQDVKEKFTGGSVAVVGKNTILQENVVPKQITPITTNFFDIVNHLALANFRTLKAYVDFDGGIKQSENVISFIFKVEENTKYILKSDNITFNRANAVGSNQDNFEISGTYTKLENSKVSQGAIEFTVPEGINFVCIYVYTGSDYSLESVELNKDNLYLFKDSIPQNKFDKLNKNFLPEDILYKDTDISKSIKNNTISPNLTTFFNYYNLLDFSNSILKNGTCDTMGRFTENNEGKVFIFEVAERKKYFLKLPTNSNRTFLIESNEPFVSGKSYPIVAINNESENVWSFTPNEGIKYIMCYCYNGVEDVIDKKDFVLTDNLEGITKKSTVKKENLPEDILYKNVDVSKFIKNKTLTPEKCSFFTDYNLLKDAAIENGTVDTTGLFVKGSEGKVLIMPVEGNKHYVLKVPISSNRSFILESTTQFEDRSKYTIIQRVPTISNSTTKLYTFDTSENAKYVLVYFYNGADVSVDLQDFFLADEFENIDRPTSLDITYVKSLPKEWEGKKILTMGDSITAINENESSWPRSWRKYFKEIIKPNQFSNTAVPGATWTDKEGTIYDGNPVINGADENKNNVMGNQIEKILRAKDPNHHNYSKVEEYDDFDVIVIACGTNDTHREIPTREEIEKNFYNVNTPITDLSVLDRKTWTGAMRYCIDTLRKLYPNAQIFVTTPIQKTVGSRYEDVSDKNIIIKSICQRLSIPVIDTLSCGVYDLSCPSGGKEGDYNDGLHLSPVGAKKLGRYIANSIKNFI
ncbi:SGNH/GDSL hydrolase family protein [Clostridium perfringens]|uniref:SGNH/GDSL hydrolase family protein n=1 Tax=Clostridium perfringens TaxID=1502 RepID=UPI0032DA2BC1